MTSKKPEKLQEQAARMFAEGTKLKDSKLELVHIGRVKDVRDLIEIETAYEVTNKTGIAKEIVTYAKIAAKILWLLLAFFGKFYVYHCIFDNVFEYFRNLIHEYYNFHCIYRE